MEMNKYKSASGHSVTLYKGDKGICTVVDLEPAPNYKFEITIYDLDGNIMCGAKNISAAWSLIDSSFEKEGAI